MIWCPPIFWWTLHASQHCASEGAQKFALTFKKMKPLRQVEATQLMAAMNKYTIAYVRSLVAATPGAMLVRPKKPIRGLTVDQIALMENEAASLDREFKAIEHDFGTDHLDLVLTTGYLIRLLSNGRVVGYLA